jgi:type I restriction enzyme S subunit
LKSFNRGGGYRLDGLKEYTGKFKPEQEVFAGDLIIAYTDVTQAADVIGKPAMVISDARYDHLVISLDVAVVRPENDDLKYYLYGVAKTDHFQQHTKAHSTGTTVLHLSKNAVPEYKFTLASDDLVKAYRKHAQPIFSDVNENIEQNNRLSAYRDTLLPKLLSGDLPITNTEVA